MAEITEVVLEIPCVVREVGLALLQERFRLPERQPEDASDLFSAERAVTIRLQGHGFERAARPIVPCRLQTLRDVLGQVDGDSRHPFIYAPLVSDTSGRCRGVEYHGLPGLTANRLPGRKTHGRIKPWPQK